MNIVFFAHPTFLKLRSMDSFTKMLFDGMRKRGHNVQVWHPNPLLSKFAAGGATKKWLGYLDQYVLFPIAVRFRVRHCPRETLFVFTDQALGPWVPLVRNKRHVIHCHDFLALQSATGSIPENKTQWTGRFYQQYIKRGFLQGENFIAVSNKTSEQLKNYHPEMTIYNEVVYNGLNSTFYPVARDQARSAIALDTGINTCDGYILHIGGNQWYKNRRGVVEIYDAWRRNSDLTLPLLLVGESPSTALIEQVSRSRFSSDIHFVYGKDDQFVQTAYSGARVLLFPSLAEGFGWPIAEAMACGCPVITTNQAPMTEVGANAALYIDIRPSNPFEVPFWADDAAKLIARIVGASDDTIQNLVNTGLENAKRFNLDDALDKIEKIYLEVD